MKITVPINSCTRCPAFYSDSEYPHTRCKFAKQSWGMGYYEDGDSTPEWCPLKKGPITVELEK